MKTEQLVTHSGSFHADDVLACCVLKTIYPEAMVVRTRDQAILGSTSQSDVVFDVGYRYDADLRLYDHHQPGRALREDGSPYSSFGLVWKHHGMAFLATVLPDAETDVLEAVWDDLDRGFVTSIDHADNGYVPPGAGRSSGTDISLLVEDFVPSWNEPDADYDERFGQAVVVFSEMLRRRIAKSAALAMASAGVLAAFRSADDPRIVVIPDYMPVGAVVRNYGFDDAVYLVEHSRSGEWFVNCVRPEGQPFGQRKPLPSAWAGLRGADLAAVTGVVDAVFCHLQRFTCAAGTKESAMRLARLALVTEDQDPEPKP